MTRTLSPVLALLGGCMVVSSAVPAGVPASERASGPAAAAQPGAFHFTVAGDPRYNVAGFTKVLQAIRAKVGGAGVFHVSIGDNTPPSKIRAAVDECLGPATIWFPGVGNHEAGHEEMMAWLRAEYAQGHDKRPALKAQTNQDGPVGCEETTYSWDHGNAHFVTINEYWNGKTDPGSDAATKGDIPPELLKWLEGNLKANRRPVVFVFGHEPAYPQARRHAGSSLNFWPQNRDAFWKLLEARGVQAYICGHTHFYSRCRRPGGKVWQIDVGNAGRTSDPEEGKIFVDVTVSPTAVQYDVWRDGGGKEFKLAESWTESIEAQGPEKSSERARRPGTKAFDVVMPEAKAQTEPVPNGGDAADDPAIWLHPTDPAKSLIIGTDKRGGMHVYDMDGKDLQLVSDGCRPDNVDVLYGFRLGDGVVDLAVASVRASKSSGVKVWRIDPAARRLTDVTAGGALPVFSGTVPYGVCTYRSAKTGKGYFFVNNKAGRIEQHELQDAGAGMVKAVQVRRLRVGSVTEGCVADDELGWVYFAEEGVGIWRFAAEPDGGVEGKLVAKVRDHGLTADVEGLTIYCASGGKGYLIASSQGSNTFLVYTRRDNRYLLTIDPKGGRIDDVRDTDGIAVTNRPTSKQFPAGLLIVQDGSNAGGKQNFKLYDWRDIAGKRLRVDTKPAPRRR